MSRFIFLVLIGFLGGCALSHSGTCFSSGIHGYTGDGMGRNPVIISNSFTATKQQPHYENSDDFRERLGKKIFDYEHAKPGFNPKCLTQNDAPCPLSQLIAKNVLSRDEANELSRSGIKSYGIFWEDCWWGRTYWFYFYYRNGNVFSYDVHTNMKKNAVIYD